MRRRPLGTSGDHDAALDRIRDRYSSPSPVGAAAPATTGSVIVFADGCASWLTYADRAVGLEPARVLATLIADPIVGHLWDGAHVARYDRPDGPGGTLFDVELGVALPSYSECPRHREGGTAR